jgi:SAM-dependent methyltransferase
MNEVADIYNALFNFEASSKAGPYPIHKKLHLGDTCSDIPDWIIQNKLCSVGASVLDVGCGTGNTLFKLAKFKQASGLGISISREEIEFANDQLEKLDKSPSIAFLKQSFDDPIPNQKFDVIVAIESLKHSHHLSKTVKNLLSASHDHTIFIIADDFIIKNRSEIDEQKYLWKASGFMTLAEFEAAFNQNGKFQWQRHDFTNKVKTKSKLMLGFLIQLTRLSMWLSRKKSKLSLEIYLGGLLLEYLYKKGAVSYQILIAKKINDGKI